MGKHFCNHKRASSSAQGRKTVKLFGAVCQQSCFVNMNNLITSALKNLSVNPKVPDLTTKKNCDMKLSTKG